MKVYSFVSKANQYLLFTGILLMMVFFTFMIIKEFTRDGYQPPKVEIVNDTTGPTEIKYSKDYVTRIKDVHVLKIRSNQIDPKAKHGNVLNNVEYFSGESDRSYKEGSTVNFLFVTADGENHLLFEQDKFFQSFSLASFEHKTNQYKQFRIAKSLYLVAAKDTNNDGFLSGKDELDLYISEYNGEQLALLMENVNYYNEIGDHTVLVASGQGEHEEYFILNANSREMEKLNTSIPKPKGTK